MAKQWTPPSDAAVTENNKFVPPSDAAEVKKKEVSQSTLNQSNTSSARLNKTTTKPTVSSSLKDNGQYTFPGQEGVSFKKEGNNWYRREKDSYEYKQIKEPARINNLEKRALSEEKYSFETAPAPKQEKAKFQAAPKAAPAKPVTQTEKAAQKAFTEEFKPLALDSPEYLKRKKESDLIESKVGQITPDLINDNEGDVVPRIKDLIKDYPYLSVSESGIGYDELEIVNNATGEREKINLENWTSDRDQKEAKRLQGFLDIQMNSKDYVDQYKKVNYIKDQMSDATPTDRIKLSEQLLEEQGKLNELKTSRYLKAGDDQYKLAALYDKNAKENIKTDFAKLQIQTIDYSEKVKSYSDWTEKINEARKAGKITDEQYQAEYAPKLAEEKRMLIEEKDKISKDFAQTRSESDSIDNIAANQYAIESERGNILTGASFSALQGAENSLRFLLETGDFQDGEFKGLLTEAAPGSISETYTSAEGRNSLEQIVFGLANSGGSALVGAAIGSPFLGLYASSYVNMKDQMSSPAFKDVPEWQKILMSGVYGGTVGVLEKYGVSKWFQKTPAGKGLTNWILKKTISELGEDASSEAIELAIKKNLNAAVANGLIQITSAGLVEGSTELAQEGADMIYKDVFNKLSEKKYFENPKSWAGVADRLSQSFILGFAGGAGMNSISQATEIGRNELTKAQIDNITQFINDPELQDTFKMNLKDQILSGQITKDDAKRQVERLNELEGTIKKIPENVDRYQAFKLLNERDDIQKEIAGKDPALVAAQNERINAINEELKTISQNAVQEQTTSEVSVQPGAEVGGEMAQGESQAGSQVATEEGTITEEEKVTPAPETDQVATYRAEEQSELLKAIPKIESYKVNGEIDKTLMPKTVLAKYNKIYEKYDKLISPLLETTEQPSNNLVTEDNINDVIQRQTTPVQQKLAKSAKLVMKALPGSKIFLHETQEDFDNAIGEKTDGTERGAFIPSDGSIHINMQVALPHTLLHEAFHAVVLSKKLDNNTLNAWTKGLKGIVKDKALLDRLNNLTELYSAEEQSEEFISELGSIMGEAQKTLSTSGFQKFKVLINKIAAKAGLPPIFTAASTAQDAVDFINTISGKLTRGEEIYVNDPGDGGEVGTFNIPDAKFQKAKSVADDPRDFIRELVQDVDLREFNGQKFITNMYDYTNAGKTDLGNGFSIDMLGGKNYVPLMMSLNGKGIGDVSNLAAFNTKEQAETFIRNSEKGGAKLFAPHAGTLDNSWQFQQHTFAELFNLVLDAGILTPNELIAVFNNTIKDSKANQAQFQQFANRYGEDIKSFDSFESDPKKIVDLLDIKNNYSPKLRKALNNAIASNKKFQQAIGVNNKNEFYQRIMDPLNQGMTGGEIMNIVEFDPNTFEIVETKPNNADHHPSFGFALLAKINGIYQPTQLFKSVDVTESYTKYNKGGEEVSRKADEPKFEEKNVSSSAGAIPKTAEFIESMPAKTSKRKKQIIGKSAELSDNTRRNLELAKAIEMTGADQNTIFVETGWFRGTDGKWKYEVPDELTFMRFAMSDLKPKLKDGYMAEVGANQIIGKNLLLAYPQLSDITFEFTKGEGRNYYNPIDNVIRLSIDETNDEIYSTYVHEVQHAIQYIENFAKGGGKETAAKTEKGKAAAKRLKKATVVAGNKNPLLYDKGIKSGADYVSLLQEELLVNNSMSWRKENGYFEKGVSVVDLIKKFIKSDKETLLQDKNSVLELLDASVYHHEVTGLRGYLKLAGEVESRNIETRLKMGQEERKSTVPNSTEDVAAEDQILYFDFDTMKSERKKQLTTDKDAKPGYDAALEALNETEAQREAWRKKNKVNQKQKRNPIVEQAVKDYYNEEISQEEYLDIVAKNQPIKPFKQVPVLPSLEDITNSLDSSKVATGIIGLTKNLNDGEKVASRLDIPAYEDYDTWVVSLHDGNKEGKSIAYGQTAVLKNVDFKTFPGPAIRIAMGTQNKSTIARMFGEWVNEDPEAVHARAKELMNDPAWTQVGMNPFRYSWFYDKADGMPLASADEVVQVGALVLAKNAKKVSPSDPMFETKSAKGGKIKFQKQAPNGKPSNLNDKQWEQVRTPAFKKWFGDWENDPKNASKVVDENGEPKVVYHGSMNQFDEFKKEELGKATGSESSMLGFYFSDNKEVSETYIGPAMNQLDPNLDGLQSALDKMTKKQLGQFDVDVLNYADSSDNYSDTEEDLEYFRDDLFSAVRQDTESYIFDSRRLIEKAEKFIRSNNIDPDFRAYPEGYIYPTFINIRNPYIKDYKGDLWEYTPEFDNISKNNDGAILENTLDSVPTDERDGGIESNVFIVFEPNQIKSATENVGTFSAETPKIKFQKNEAIQKAKEKYDLSVKERGNTKEQGINSALEDLRKSDWYNKADDIQREEAERELKKFFGQKIKSAPSINKITGAKPTKIQVDEAAALKSQLRLEARAARDAKTDLNTKRKQIAAFIRSLETKGTITARQASALVKRASSLNLDNPVMIVRFENYAEKIFQRAEYQDLLTSAFKVRRLIRKAIKSENQAEVVGMAKLFSQIDPSLVDDIDNYIEITGNVLNAVRPSKEKGMDVALRQAANIEIVSEYANEEIAKQEENRKRELMSEYKYLVDSGVLTEDLSVKEMQEIINLIDNPNAEFDPEADQKKLKFLQNRLASMEAVFRYMTANNINPFTGEEVVIEAKDADLIKRLLKMDLTEMSVKDAAKVVEAMDNYLMNNITSGLEAAVRSYEGAQNAKQLVAQGKKARPLRSYFNKTIGRFFGEQMISLPLLFEKMFPGIKNSANIMQKMGLVDVINGSNKAIRQQNDLMTEYSKEDFYKEDGFMEAKNVYERGMLAFLKRNLTGTKTEIRDEFKRRAEIIKQSIEALRENGTDKEIEMADLYQEIYDKLGVAELDLDVIEARASKMNKDAVAWMVNQWGKYYGELADVSLSVYNSMLGSDTNYTPDRYKSLSAEDQGLDEALLNSGSGFMMSMDYTDKNKTGVLMEATRPKVLPKGRYISLDFDVNNFNSLKGALVDINTAAAIRQIDGFTKSKAFSKLIPDANDRKILTKRINTYIQRAKGKRTVTSDTMKDVERLANFISGLGVGKALAGLDQPIKQTVPVMINTMINSGGTMTFVNPDMNEAINRSGMPIANRGLEAQTTVESIDRLLDKKGGFGAEAIKKLENLNQFWLKTLLAKPDVWVARSSFITYYLKDMKSKGENVKDIDWSKHEWNQDSAEYAQLMVDRQQNISDDKLAGEFLSSDDSTRRIARKVIMPFATFIMNQKARMHNDFLALRSKDTSVEDRKSAIKSLTGLGAELFAYQLIAYGVKTLIYDNIANYLVGDDDEEEKKDKSLFGLKMTAKQYSATKFPVKSIVGDILSPLPIFDDLITMGFDKAMESFPQISNEDIKKSVDEKNTILRLQGKDEMDDNAKAKFIEQLKADNIYSVAFKNDSQAGRAYGMIGIAYDTYKELIDLSRMAYTGEFEDEYQGRVTNKYLPEEDRKILQNISVPLMIAYSTGLLPKDLGTVARKVTNIVKKKGVTENQHEKEKEVKKQINRDLSSWEFELVKTRKKANGVVDEINYVESKGGLNDKQGKEYVKLMDAFPAPSDDMLIDIQKGMTADQIIKKNKG